MQNEFIRRLLNKTLKPVLVSRLGKVIRKLFPFLRPSCRFFPFMIVVLSDGTVTTCCHDARGENNLGSLYQMDLETVWKEKIEPILSGSSADLYDLIQCKRCLGTSLASLIPRRKDYREWQKFISGYPRVLQVEIMGRCNYGCCFASRIHKYRETKLDLDKTFESIKGFLPHIEQLNLYSCGEPLLHEDFCDFVAKCREGCSSVVMELCTNAMLMDEKVDRCLIEQKVDQVVVSIHGGPGTENMLKYSKYGADYEKVLANIRRLADLRKKYRSEYPRIQTKTILFEWNDTDELMEKLRKDTRAAGVDGVYWALDCGTGALSRSSKRFMQGSKALAVLEANGELFHQL